MKKILAILFVLVTLSAQAQTLEHNVYVGGGLFTHSEGNDSEKGLMLKLGYGLNVYFSEDWSVMPGVAYREVSENTFKSSKDGANDKHFKFIDVPVIAQYHIGNGKDSWTVGLGPVFSFCVGNDTYSINSDPKNPKNGIELCKPFSISLQPSVAYQFAKHWRVGAEYQFSLTDMKHKDDIYLDGSRHVSHIGLFVNFNF